MSQSLKAIFQIQKVLNDSGYHDISRISDEIFSFCKGDDNNISGVLKRISTNEPWEYIKGSCEFKGSDFVVTKDTLIPRIETEMLVDIALKNIDDTYSSIVDVGTGSGCIIISIAKSLDGYKMFGTDISDETLNVARENQSRILKDSPILFVKSDLIKDLDISEKIFFLANLPYIPTDEYLSLDNSVKDFEPRSALDGGDNGLMCFERLFKQINEKGIEKGSILCEIEPKTINGFLRMAKEFFPESDFNVFKDQFDKDRFVLIRLC